MRAILGCLLMVTGSMFAAEQLLFDGAAFWAGAGAAAAGVALLVRGALRTDPGHDHRSCSTCRGAGTVYTAEYNDWRLAGPITAIRELCPVCAGLARG